MWLHIKWRELLQSMSWLRPGDKFDKSTLIQDTKGLDRAFFQFYSEYNGWKAPEGGNDYVYVKVTQ